MTIYKRDSASYNKNIDAPLFYYEHFNPKTNQTDIRAKRFCSRTEFLETLNNWNSLAEGEYVYFSRNNWDYVNNTYKK